MRIFQAGPPANSYLAAYTQVVTKRQAGGEIYRTVTFSLLAPEWTFQREPVSFSLLASPLPVPFPLLEPVPFLLLRFFVER